MSESVELRAERHLDALLWYLFEYRTPVPETTAEQFERSVISANAFFDTEAFSISYSSRNTGRISCNCGWSLGLLLPADLDAQALAAPLAECLRRMVLHYEIQHNGLKRAGNEQ
ncbi:MAG TPA: hypothetical protein VFB43_06700 [Terracidiphilus sp.]|nr:hypothetical protein [Terracidiphilus sp.]